MATNPVLAQVKQIRKLIESLGPPIVFRKMIGLLNALEMQVEDAGRPSHAQEAATCSGFKNYGEPSRRFIA